MKLTAEAEERELAGGGVPIGDRGRQTKKVGWPGGHVTVRDMRR